MTDPKRREQTRSFRLGIDGWPDWAWEFVKTNDIIIHGEGAMFDSELTHAEIETPFGVMRAVRGDWIVRGDDGRPYPAPGYIDSLERVYEHVERKIRKAQGEAAE